MREEVDMNNDNNNSSNSNQQSQETPECEKETRAILPDIVLYNHVYFQNQILKKTLVYKYNLHLNLTFVRVTHAYYHYTRSPPCRRNIYRGYTNKTADGGIK